jgi:SAM-dependent methyltransferase
MAITQFTYTVTRMLFEQQMLPADASVLEFGEANWYGDVDNETLIEDIEKYAAGDDARKDLLARLDKANESNEETRLFETAKIFYRLCYGCRAVEAIDLNGTEVSTKHDLNEDLVRDDPVDVTINNGTAEHVFFARRVFQSMHQCTKPGGLMVHEGPLINGWINHGFYNFQPILFFDLTRHNNYDTLFFVGQINPFKMVQLDGPDDVLAMAEGPDFPANPAFFVVFRKSDEDKDFSVPMQGYYAGAVSDAAREAWRRMR